MTWTNAVRSGLGYSWALLCLLAVLATFVGLGFWSQALATATGIQVSAWYSGGAVRQTSEHDGYRTLLHRPVFDGLIGERSEGFVQIDWVPAEGRPLPAVIAEELDVDGDDASDLALRLDTAANSVRLERQAPWVLGADHVVVADQERIVRVRLRNRRASR